MVQLAIHLRMGWGWRSDHNLKREVMRRAPGSHTQPGRCRVRCGSRPGARARLRCCVGRGAGPGGSGCCSQRPNTHQVVAVVAVSHHRVPTAVMMHMPTQVQHRAQ